MKKFLVLMSIVGLLLLAACGSSDVKTGGTGNSTEKKTETNTTKEEKPKEDNSKTVDVTSQKMKVVGMEIGLGEIKIAEDRISVGINLKNTTDKALNFYPDQGKLVVGDMQLDANMFMTEGDIGGEVQGGVKQEAVLVFTAPDGKKLDVKSITQIKLILGDVTTEDYMTSKPVNFTIPVK